jgi:hypothetical protein
MTDRAVMRFVAAFGGNAPFWRGVHPTPKVREHPLAQIILTPVTFERDRVFTHGNELRAGGPVLEGAGEPDGRGGKTRLGTDVPAKQGGHALV